MVSKKEKSTIDLLQVKKEKGKLMDVRVKRDSGISSEHYLLESKLKTKMKTKQSEATPKDN